MWCVPELTSEFVERMEDLLRLYGRKLDPMEPIVCLDERPVVLREDARRGQPMKPGVVKHRDYEYVRCGTANIFCIIEPLAGKRLTFATADRKRRAYVWALKKIAARYKRVRRIHLVQDNLNTHSEKSAIKVLGPLEGRRLWRRFEVHYTPKHGSWLNVAELEASLVARECLGRERISALVDLISSVSAWRRAAESAGRTIDWTFTVDDARRKFRYDGLVTARSRH